MRDWELFLTFLIIILLQRGIELVIAKNNERWMKEQGAIEFGKRNYKYILIMHTLFFLVLFCEKLILNKGLSLFWPYLLIIFFISQALRFWVLFTLGKYWNTKIIVLPDAKVIRKGPYRFIRHPNYFIVSLELFILPLMFDAFLTACVFSVLNIIILSTRIPEEEHALKKLTEYEKTFRNCNRFLPKLLNKYDS